MSNRTRLRVATGVTNAGVAATEASKRPGTASIKLEGNLRDKYKMMSGVDVPRKLQRPLTSSTRQCSGSNYSSETENSLERNCTPLPPLEGWGGVSSCPRTSTEVLKRPSTGPGHKGHSAYSTPPSVRLSDLSSMVSWEGNGHGGKGSNGNGNGVGERCIAASPSPSPSPSPVLSGNNKSGDGRMLSTPEVDPRRCLKGAIPLGLSKLLPEDLEAYVDAVRADLTRHSPYDLASGLGAARASGSVSSGVEGGANPSPRFGHGEHKDKEKEKEAEVVTEKRKGIDEQTCLQSVQDQQRSDYGAKGTVASGGGRFRHSGKRRHLHHHHHHHHHHHLYHPPRNRQQRGRKVRAKLIGKAPVAGSSSSSPPVAADSMLVWEDKRDVGSGSGVSGSNSMTTDTDANSWYARSKDSKTCPLRTLMLDPEVNNFPKVKTQSDFRALIKGQNIPHPSYDIDGDGTVSQEDYALAKRFDVNGDGVLDKAEQVVGRRIMVESFLDKHANDLHLYDRRLAQKTVEENVDNISRSRGFKKIMNELREKEQHFNNNESFGVRDCVTLKPESLTRHNFFTDKMDTTAWNDFTRDPRDPGWLEGRRHWRRHDGSRNQMHFMRKVKARESAQDQLIARHKEQDSFSARRVTLITNPAVENS